MQSVVFSPADTVDLANRAVFDYAFTHDTDVVGNMALTVFLDVEDADAVDLFVGVEKLDCHGNEVYFFSASGGNANGPVSRGWLRMLRSGEITEANIAIMPSGTTFRNGERLRLVIQYYSLPGQFEGGETRRWDTLGHGRARLYTGGCYPSRLLIPTLY
ncbi:MAG: hypothetical protein K2Q25_03695 [Mycobacteriaceae bacterium]|nr:hypothetical protein [Mycobacteriaceae bacterium]